MESSKRSSSTGRKQPKRLSLVRQESKNSGSVFDNLPEFISPQMVAEVLPYEASTIYDWKYRPAKYDVPHNLFQAKKKKGEKLLLRRDVLRAWKCS